jgi:pyruvate/2-oxoglutarate dehydrogenase complex dihydrolipoamide dehydrogenase (E3) component
VAERINCDIAVVGAGAGGLMVAAGAAMLGRRVLLIERGKMGGDCLNYGCVPSKALLAAAHRAVAHRHSAGFGVHYDAPRIDFNAVMCHLRQTIAAIAPHDSVERFQGLGVDVRHAEAHFQDADTLVIDGASIHARRIVLATGSTPAIPAIPGIDGSGYLTNETVFDLTELPRQLLILGGGAVGLELAQAFQRLGSAVTVIEKETCLAREDAELTAPVLAALRADGVVLHEQCGVTRISRDGKGVTLHLSGGSSISGTHLLLATGRRANTVGLGLEQAGIALGPKGIAVDQALRTSNQRVYAIGDATGLHPFTHTAGYHAGLVLRHALFRLPVRADHTNLPRGLFTDPEFAAAGLSEAEARAQQGEVRVLTAQLSDNDRGRAERLQHGLIKAIVTPRGKLLGIGITGPNAAELIQPWLLVLQRGLKIGALQSMVPPYPTLGESGKRAAGDFFRPQLDSPWLRRLANIVARFG